MLLAHQALRISQLLTEDGLYNSLKWVVKFDFLFMWALPTGKRLWNTLATRHSRLWGSRFRFLPLCTVY